MLVKFSQLELITVSFNKYKKDSKAQGFAPLRDCLSEEIWLDTFLSGSTANNEK